MNVYLNKVQLKVLILFLFSMTYSQWDYGSERRNVARTTLGASAKALREIEAEKDPVMIATVFLVLLISGIILLYCLDKYFTYRRRKKYRRVLRLLHQKMKSRR